jgi:quercetin dioxygenase-like cupin family protein
LEEHAAPGPIFLAVREGRIRFSTRDGKIEAVPETLLAGVAGELHAVGALEDAVCVVTIERGGGC